MSVNPELHVIFGTGPLGLAIARDLVGRGKSVKMVNRSGKAGAPAGVAVVAGDAYNADFVRAAAQGAAVVYMCAQPAYHEWPAKFPPLLSSVLDGVASVGAKFIMGDNLYMYGDTNGQPIREDMPLAAHTRKGRTRAQMDEMIMAAHGAGKVRAAIGHAADFYGPGVLDSALGERAIVPALQGKKASLVGKLDVPHSYAYIEDFGRALAMLGERDEALGQHWIVPHPPTLTQRELMTLFFEEIGKPPQMSGMGKTMMMLGGLFIPVARESVEMMYEFEKPFVVDDSKFKRAFGDIATPHGTGVKATVAWYRQNGH